MFTTLIPHVMKHLPPSAPEPEPTTFSDIADSVKALGKAMKAITDPPRTVTSTHPVSRTDAVLSTGDMVFTTKGGTTMHVGPATIHLGAHPVSTTRNSSTKW